MPGPRALPHTPAPEGHWHHRPPESRYTLSDWYNGPSTMFGWPRPDADRTDKYGDRA